MGLNELRDEVHQVAVEKGWWSREQERTVGDLIALMHSELSEALEEHRKGHSTYEVYYPNAVYHHEKAPEFGKPEGVPVELADCIIRILDFCGYYNIDIEQAVEIKVEYNRSRSHRHGNKVL